MVKQKQITKIDSFLSTGSIDKIGKVFTNKGKVYRGIYPDHVNYVLELLRSGLINNLSQKNLFPETKVTHYYTKEFPLVVEHKKIWPSSYPQEWSFEMLKDAALTILKVNSIAKSYGYQLLDAHRNNIIFDYTQPKFIDLGSFTKLESKKSWFASEEFLMSFYYPLMLWSQGYDDFSNNCVTHSTFLRIKYHIPNLILNNAARKLSNFYYPLSRLSSIPEELIKNRVPASLFKTFKLLKKYQLLPFQTFKTDKYVREITNLKGPQASFWSKYNKQKKYTPRFYKIANIVKSKNIKNITDIASNNGALSTLLIQNNIIDEAKCLDYDKYAIDQLYLWAKRRNQKIIPLAQNIFNPYLLKSNEELTARFKSDAVFALAITHHLLLTQYLNIEKILSTICSFSRKYVFIEFMPLGLWNGNYTPPTPSWYTPQWFEKQLSQFCKIERIIKLEKNRILFIGNVKKN